LRGVRQHGLCVPRGTSNAPTRARMSCRSSPLHGPHPDGAPMRSGRTSPRQTGEARAESRHDGASTPESGGIPAPCSTWNITCEEPPRSSATIRRMYAREPYDGRSSMSLVHTILYAATRPTTARAASRPCPCPVSSRGAPQAGGSCAGHHQRFTRGPDADIWKLSDGATHAATDGRYRSNVHPADLRGSPWNRWNRCFLQVSQERDR